MDPFRPPQSPFEPVEVDDAPPQLEPLAVALAFVVLLGSGALLAFESPLSPPMLVAPALALFGIALFVPNAPRWAALPLVLALPVALMAFHLDGPELQILNASFHQQGWALGVHAVVASAPIYVLARGSLQHALPSVACLVLALSLRDQAATIGMQFILPGVAVWALTALLPYTAAERGVGVWGALANSVRRIPKAPLAWLTTSAGLLAVAVVPNVVVVLGADDAVAAVFDPIHAVDWPLRATAGVLAQAIWGGTVLFGGTLYHREIRS